MSERLRPSDIRFTQDSIGSRFTDGSYISNTFHDLLFGLKSTDDIDDIEVVQQDGVWWAITGNRRLYVYRRLQDLGVVTTIPVRVRSLSEHGFETSWITVARPTAMALRPFAGSRKPTRGWIKWWKNGGVNWLDDWSVHLRTTSMHRPDVDWTALIVYSHLANWRHVIIVDKLMLVLLFRPNVDWTALVVFSHLANHRHVAAALEAHRHLANSCHCIIVD